MGPHAGTALSTLSTGQLLLAMSFCSIYYFGRRQFLVTSSETPGVRRPTTQRPRRWTWGGQPHWLEPIDGKLCFDKSRQSQDLHVWSGE